MSINMSMALNLMIGRTASKPLFDSSHRFPLLKSKDYLKLSPPSHIRSAAAQSDGTQGRVSQEEKEDSATSDDSGTQAGLFTSAQAQLNLLDQLTSSSGNTSDLGSAENGTIREQLARLVGDRDDDFIIPLGKNLKKFTPKFLTISQKRNIRRQSYLNQVSKRNDSVFFGTVGAFVLLPPLLILGYAIATGYVQLFP